MTKQECGSRPDGRRACKEVQSWHLPFSCPPGRRGKDVLEQSSTAGARSLTESTGSNSIESKRGWAGVRPARGSAASPLPRLAAAGHCFTGRLSLLHLGRRAAQEPVRSPCYFRRRCSGPGPIGSGQCWRRQTLVPPAPYRSAQIPAGSPLQPAPCQWPSALSGWPFQSWSAGWADQLPSLAAYCPPPMSCQLRRGSGCL